jgi:hypothetical protein
MRPWLSLALVLTACGATGPAAPRGHDHAPRHGGVVTMVGMLHLETVAGRDGVVRLYLTDVRRAPLGVADVAGVVEVDLPGGRRALPVVARGDVLEADGPPLAGDSVALHVRLTRAGAPLAADVVLALDGGGRGAPGVPAVACEPVVAPPGASARRPRCTLAPSAPITGLATHGTDVLLLAVDGIVSAWRMPTMAFARGFAPPPPAPGDAAPHADVVTAIALAPDGGETAVAVENRILVYETATGRLRRELPSRAGDVRAVAWSPDGALLLASVVEHGGTAWLVRADDGRSAGRVPLEHVGGALAFAASGRAAVGGLDEIALVTPDGAARVLAEPMGPVDALAFADDRLLSGSGDGAVRVWDVATGRAVARWPAPGGILALAPAPDGRRVASAGRDGVVRVHDLDGDVVATLAWHDAPVVSLAWSGTALVSGDAAGRIAVWEDLPRP